MRVLWILAVHSVEQIKTYFFLIQPLLVRHHTSLSWHKTQFNILLTVSRSFCFKIKTWNKCKRHVLSKEIKIPITEPSFKEEKFTEN